MRARTLAATAVAAVGLAALPAGAQAARGFTLGVAAGQVTDDSALLWAHSTKAGTGFVEITTARNFGGDGALAIKRAKATKSHDNTVQAKLVDLSPDTTYYYRFSIGKGSSDIGSFRTAPKPS